MAETCSLCKQEIGDQEESFTLTENGADQLLSDLKEIQSDIRVIAGDLYHHRCKRDIFNSKKCFKSEQGCSESTASKERVHRTGFDYRTCCLFCGRVVAERVPAVMQVLLKTLILYPYFNFPLNGLSELYS